MPWERQATSEDDSGELPLRTHLPDHESQSADHDRNQDEWPRERTDERAFEIARGALPGRSLR